MSKTKRPKRKGDLTQVLYLLYPLILVGLGYLAYPYVSEWYFDLGDTSQKLLVGAMTYAVIVPLILSFVNNHGGALLGIINSTACYLMMFTVENAEYAFKCTLIFATLFFGILLLIEFAKKKTAKTLKLGGGNIHMEPELSSE